MDFSLVLEKENSTETALMWNKSLFDIDNNNVAGLMCVEYNRHDPKLKAY